MKLETVSLAQEKDWILGGNSNSRRQKNTICSFLHLCLVNLYKKLYNVLISEL